MSAYSFESYYTLHKQVWANFASSLFSLKDFLFYSVITTVWKNEIITPGINVQLKPLEFEPKWVFLPLWLIHVKHCLLYLFLAVAIVSENKLSC